MNSSMSQDIAAGCCSLLRNWLERTSLFVDSLEGSDLFADCADDDGAGGEPDSRRHFVC